MQSRDEKDFEKALSVVKDETENVKDLIELRLKDSKIGYESSTHYFYTLQDLKEKLINLEYIKTKLINK